MFHVLILHYREQNLQIEGYEYTGAGLSFLILCFITHAVFSFCMSPLQWPGKTARTITNINIIIIIGITQ